MADTTSAEGDPAVWAHTKTTPTERLLVIANCGRGVWTVGIGRDWPGAALLPGRPSSSGSTVLDLAGWDARTYSGRS